MEENDYQHMIRILEAIRLSFLTRLVAADPGLGLYAEALQAERRIRQMSAQELLRYTQEVERSLESQVHRMRR